MTVDSLTRAAQRDGITVFEAGMHHEAVQQALQAAKGNLPGRFLAEGLWLNRQAVEYHAVVETLLLCPERIFTDEWEAECERMMRHCGSVALISPKVYDRLSTEKSDAGALSVIRLPQWTLADIPAAESSLLLVLDGLENPGNVGTLIRTADGAGADAVVLCNKKTGLANRMVVRSSLCTLLVKPVVEADEADVLAFLQSRGYTVYLGKAEESRRYCEIEYAPHTALVVGHEKYGVSPAFFAQPHTGVSIPMLGRVDSLNVAVAGSILLYEAARSHGFIGGHST
jgi:TrmH family RNA methyltransferase